MGYNFGVGRAAPTFVLATHDGGEIDLRQYRGDWFPILLFFSVAAPGAAARLQALAGQAGTFWGLRGQLVGVTSGDADEIGAFVADAPGLSFPLAVDDGRVAAAYGAGKAVDGVAPPLAVIVDRAGKVVWMGEGDDVFKPATLLSALRSIAR